MLVVSRAHHQMELMTVIPGNGCSRPVLLVDLLPGEDGMGDEYYSAGAYDQVWMTTGSMGGWTI